MKIQKKGESQDEEKASIVHKCDHSKNIAKGKLRRILGKQGEVVRCQRTLATRR